MSIFISPAQAILKEREALLEAAQLLLSWWFKRKGASVLHRGSQEGCERCRERPKAGGSPFGGEQMPFGGLSDSPMLRCYFFVWGGARLQTPLNLKKP